MRWAMLVGNSGCLGPYLTSSLSLLPLHTQLKGEAEASDQGMPSEVDPPSPAEDTGSIMMNLAWAQYQAWASFTQFLTDPSQRP